MQASVVVRRLRPYGTGMEYDHDTIPFFSKSRVVDKYQEPFE